MTLTASYTAQLLNVSELAAPFQMTRQTIQDYVTVLERIFLVDRLPPWHANRLSRLVKTAKLHAGDTGLACARRGIGDTVRRRPVRLSPAVSVGAALTAGACRGVRVAASPAVNPRSRAARVHASARRRLRPLEPARGPAPPGPVPTS